MKARPLPAYDALLKGCPDAVTGGARTIIELAQKLDGPVTAADLGCGVGLALLTLAARARALGVTLHPVGADKGFKPSAEGPFPDHDAALSAILERYRDTIGAARIDPPPRFLRANLDDHTWPLAAGSFQLVLSNKLLMFVQDKLAFLERVWSLLGPGGVAIIELDVGLPGAAPDETPRIASPVPLSRLLAAQRERGYDIFAGAAPLLARTPEPPDAPIPMLMHSYVVSMRKNRDGALQLPLAYKGTQAFAAAPPGEDWGCVSLYEAA